MSAAAPLARVHLFPVRHHSPRSSAVLAAFLAAARPEVVLVEAPEDAEKLIPALVDPDTLPPVAILGYRTDGAPASALWPFAAYSPEYVATKWAAENKAQVAFIDIPITRSLGDHRAPVHEDRDPAGEGDIEAEEEEIAPEAPPGEPPEEGALDIHEACARARGFRTFEEFWEASFEAPAYDAASFRAALLGYADLVRAANRSVIHRARDAYMAEKIMACVKRGVPPESIVVVVGAAHAAALAAGDVDPSLLPLLPEPAQAECTLIPFSYPRLAEQLGYGAGNRAPQYYQRAHEAGCSFTRATLEVLVEFTEHLRLRGFMASLADTIEAYRLAVSLADLRGKAEPGLDEVREATIAVLCRGDATHVDGFLWPSVVGRNVGRVAGKVARNSLQEEFWREVRERRLPATDADQRVNLSLADPEMVGASVFLHRLRIAEIPYATYMGTVAGRVGGASRHDEEAGGIAALQRLSESWTAQWTPSTDIALVERIVLGDSLEAVAGKVLDERLAAARNAGEASQILADAVVISCAKTASEALSTCERLAAHDDDVPSLGTACSNLSWLTSYNNARSQGALRADVIRALCVRVYDRAVLRAEPAAACDDDAAGAQGAALARIHNVAVSQPAVDKEAWFAAGRSIAASYAVNPSIAGAVTAMLYMAHVLTEEDVTSAVAQRLSSAAEPARAARFLEGFFSHTQALVGNPLIVAALDAFLAGIDKDRFRDTLPLLRRAFGSLGASARRNLLERVIGQRKIGEKAKAAAAILTEKDKDKLKAMSADLAKAMDDLDDLL